MDGSTSPSARPGATAPPPDARPWRPAVSPSPSASPRPVQEIAARLGLDDAHVIPYGRHAVKVDLAALESRRASPDGKLVVVSSITPTPPGDGKTTVTIGLGQALTRIGRRAVIALREPSIGPCLGIKGGGTGGGRSQVVPSELINLHFTGDIHAV